MDVKGAFKRDKGEKKRKIPHSQKAFKHTLKGGKTLQNKKKKKQPSRFFLINYWLCYNHTTFRSNILLLLFRMVWGSSKVTKN